MHMDHILRDGNKSSQGESEARADSKDYDQQDAAWAGSESESY